MLRDLVPVVKSKANKNLSSEPVVNNGISTTNLNWFSRRISGCHQQYHLHILVGGFNPFEKYARQNGSSPQGSGWKFPKYSNHHLVFQNAGAHHQHQQRPPTWTPNLLGNPLLKKKFAMPTSHNTHDTQPRPRKKHTNVASLLSEW